MIPLLPELSFAKKEAKQGAAKIALFAYERVSLQRSGSQALRVRAVQPRHLGLGNGTAAEWNHL